MVVLILLILLCISCHEFFLKILFKCTKRIQQGLQKVLGPIVWPGCGFILECMHPLMRMALAPRNSAITIHIWLCSGVLSAVHIKGSLISDIFSFWLQSKKKRYQITVLSTIHIKRRCSGEWFGTSFGRLESNWKTFWD